ncbi:unnamed protein product [Polarella glacialis]|uniref:STAS domain-containing protein n=1 Tax=Polarella glacialis TaxID=89957 RepID=A0A813KTN3_POLGL|nr:unnamed protein product [Polarella glacialis]
MAGMHGVALGSGIMPQWTDDAKDMVGIMEKGETVEIVTCSEDISREAAQILTERHIASNPMKAYTRMCSEQLGPPMGNGEDTAEKPIPRRPKEEVSLLSKVSKVLPILAWTRRLNRNVIKNDLIAGLTVGVMAIPQSMSYASIAGLPYVNGMYSACVPTFVYAFFGQSRQLAVGPVAMVSLLVQAGLQGLLGPECDVPGMSQSQVCPDQYVALGCLCALMVGIMQAVGALLRLGFLVSFLGHPVISGFTSGAAIIIGLSQCKYMLGYDIPKSQFVYDTLGGIFSNIQKTSGMTLTLGLLWLAFLIICKKISGKYPRMRLLGPLGPLFSCLVGILLIWLSPELRDEYHVKYVGQIPSGIFPFSALEWTFADIPKIMPTALSATLIGYMESIAIGKNLASKHGYEIEAGQEMFALGVSNIVGAAFGCYPVTGSFSRSAVNNASGAMTQLSGLFTSIVMLATLMFLTPLFYFLPQFTLAAIVINSVIPLIAIGEAKKLYYLKKNDFLLWVVAFLGTLFLGVLMGIIVAVSLSLIIVIYESVRPQITILWRIPGTTIYRNMKQESNGTFIANVFIARIGSSLYFANASFVKDMLLAFVADLEYINDTEYIILEMTPVVSIDSTACHVIKDIVNDFRSRGIQTAFAMVGNRVDKTLRKADLKTFIGEQWFFHTVDEAVSYCRKHQYAKNAKLMRQVSMAQVHDQVPSAIQDTDAVADGDISAINLLTADEIGFSNDLHASCTMVFITLGTDVPMIMSEITAIFKRNQVTIVRAQIDPLNDDDGAKHIYFIKSIRTMSKLTALEMERVREELQAVLQKLKDNQQAKRAKENAGNGSMDAVQMIRNISTVGDIPTSPVAGDRFHILEQALAGQQKMSMRLEERLSRLISLQEDNLGVENTQNSDVENPFGLPSEAPESTRASI